MWVERRTNKTTGKPYKRTTALLDDGTEAIGFGDEFRVGSQVEVFFHYGVVKMRTH